MKAAAPHELEEGETEAAHSSLTHSKLPVLELVFTPSQAEPLKLPPAEAPLEVFKTRPPAELEWHSFIFRPV